MALSVRLGQAGPLISAQGYINDVGAVGTIHHAEQPRAASLPDELSTSPAQRPHRENPHGGVFTYVYVFLLGFKMSLLNKDLEKKTSQ